MKKMPTLTKCRDYSWNIKDTKKRGMKDAEFKRMLKNLPNLNWKQEEQLMVRLKLHRANQALFVAEKMVQAVILIAITPYVIREITKEMDKHRGHGRGKVESSSDKLPYSTTSTPPPVTKQKTEG